MHLNLLCALNSCLACLPFVLSCQGLALNLGPDKVKEMSFANQTKIFPPANECTITALCPLHPAAFPKYIVKPFQFRRSLGTVFVSSNLQELNRRLYSSLESTLNATRRYGPLHGPTSSSCGGLRPRLFLPVGPKKTLFCCFGQFLVSRSNLGNF